MLRATSAESSILSFSDLYYLVGWAISRSEGRVQGKATKLQTDCEFFLNVNVCVRLRGRLNGGFVEQK